MALAHRIPGWQLVALFATLLLPLVALAETSTTEQPPPRKRPTLRINHMIGATWQNPGLQYTLKLYQRYPIYDVQEGLLWRNCHLDFGLIDDVSPIHNMVGAFVEVEPIAALNVRLDAQQVTLFPFPGDASLGYFYYPPEDEELDFSVDHRSGRTELPATHTVGFRFRATLRLQLMYWRVALVNQSELSLWIVQRRADEEYWYEQISDSLHKAPVDFDWSSYSFLLFHVHGPGPGEEALMVGAGWRHLWVAKTGYRNNRFGPSLYWELGNELWFMEKPLWILAVLFHLDGPYLVDEYIPFFATALQFNTDW